MEGKIPYLTLAGREALSRWASAVAQGAPALERWCCVVSGAKSFLDDLESVGGPPPQSVQTRTTIDLHSQSTSENVDVGRMKPFPIAALLWRGTKVATTPSLVLFVLL